MGEPSYMKAPTVIKNAANLDGRCGHNMIPTYCALCNPVQWAKRKKQRKKPNKRRLTSKFILILIDTATGDELDRFWDDQVKEAKDARDEVNEVCGPDSCIVKIVDNPEHPDYVEPVEEGSNNV